MIGVGVIFSLLALIRWLGQPGTGLLLAALTFSLVSLRSDLYAAWAAPNDAIDEAE